MALVYSCYGSDQLFAINVEENTGNFNTTVFRKTLQFYGYL